MRNFIVLLFILISILSCRKKVTKTPPKVVKGVIDVSNWDFEKDGSLSLNGEWEFYYKKDLSLGELVGQKGDKKYVVVPASWSKSKELNYHQHGFGTYFIKILGLNKFKKNLVLELGEIDSAYRLYLNSKGNISNKLPFLQDGKVGSSIEKEHPRVLGRFKLVEDKGEVTYLSVNASNHIFRNGGIVKPIKLTLQSEYIKEWEYKRATQLIVAGFILMMALYHMGLYFSRKDDKASFSFSFVCLFYFIWHLSAHNFIEAYLTSIEKIYFEVLYRVELISLVMGFPFWASFLKKIFKDEVHTLFVKALWAVGLTFTTLYIVLPIKFSTHLTPMYQMVILVLLIFSIYYLIRASLNKKLGGKSILGGLFIFFLAGINDIMYLHGYSNVGYTTMYGMVLLFLSQSFVNSRLFAKAYRDLELTTKDNISLKELDKQKTNFFQSISHEIRTPLTLILNPLEDLTGRMPADKDVSLIYDNAKRLYRLVNQLLDFQKVSAGKMGVNKAPISISEFIQKCSSYFQEYSRRKKIKFIIIDKILGDIQVFGEIDALEKIMFNYLSNALKYTPENGKIEVIIEDLTEKVRITVKDSGLGIPKDKQEKLFKIFSQVESVYSSQFDGSGLGLALVKELAVKMDGDVGVSSDEGKGSSFWVELPVYKKEKEAIDILIVDDEEAMRSVVEYDVQKVTLNVLCAESAEHAREIFETHSVKCVICDLVMPEEDGLSLLSYVNETMPETIRILMTGKPSLEKISASINKARIRNVLIKPIDHEEIQQIVKDVIEEYDTAKKEREAAQYEADPDSAHEFNLENYSPKTWHLPEMRDFEDGEDVEELGNGEGELILVVDDLIDMRYVVSRTLKREQYRIITATNGREGLEKVRKYNPDLIISDWMMPEMSGIEMLEEIQQDEKFNTTPVIMITAKSDEKSRLEGKSKGALSYLSKPFDNSELVNSVKNLLSIKRKEHEIERLNKELSENILRRFLPPKVIEELSKGKTKFENVYKNKNLTILFADICGFTRKCNILGSKKISKVLNPYLEEMTKIIFEHDGVVDKFMGDSIMALFGTPIEMDPQTQVQKAVDCASRMQEAIASLNIGWKMDGYPEFTIRIGIHQGNALVGWFGGKQRSDFTAIGPTVNFAARVESSAEEKEIYLSRKVAKFLPDDAYEEAGFFKLKGIKSEVELFKYIQKDKTSIVV